MEKRIKWLKFRLKPKLVKAFRLVELLIGKERIWVFLETIIWWEVKERVKQVVKESRLKEGGRIISM
jgi:hypothetical protein